MILAVAAVAVSLPALNLRAQGAFIGGDASAQPQDFWARPRWIWLRRPATGEQIKLVYWQDGKLVQDAYMKVSWFLRDVRFQAMLASGTNPAIKNALKRGVISQENLTPWVLMDPMLLDILYAFSAWLFYFGIEEPLLVTSGFRHIVTNAMTEGAVRDSWHIKGGASDIVVPGVSPKALAQFGRWLSGGGVGLYSSRNFIHVDRGRVRSWTG